MTSSINLTTGPVGISERVMNALAERPISHRSSTFMDLFDKTKSRLCKEFGVKQVYLITGSGTMANECMMQEIKEINNQGLILSNGEFGERLIKQAQTNDVSFKSFQLPWGERFDIAEVEKIMAEHDLKWLLFCHCETSTGIINALDKLSSLCRKKNALCFVDCMSTVGTMPMDLSGIAMASASSGKGLASIPGLGIVFSNIRPSVKSCSPVYSDLAHYDECNGVPFTISSNLVGALYVSLDEKLQQAQFGLLEEYSAKIYRLLNDEQSVPFSNEQTRVFTIVRGAEMRKFEIFKRELTLSHESGYLKKRGWEQLALLGFYHREELERVVECLTLRR